MLPVATPGRHLVFLRTHHERIGPKHRLTSREKRSVACKPLLHGHAPLPRYLLRLTISESSTLQTYIIDGLYQCDEHSQHCCDQQGQQRDLHQMVAALQTPRHAHDRWARQPIQHMMAPTMGGGPPRCHIGSLGVGYTIVGDWLACMRLCDRLGS